MSEAITPERRNKLVEMFASTAEFLTNEEALEIVEIMENACHRASAELEESILKALIEGSVQEDPTPGVEE